MCELGIDIQKVAVTYLFRIDSFTIHGSIKPKCVKHRLIDQVSISTVYILKAILGQATIYITRNSLFTL